MYSRHNKERIAEYFDRPKMSHLIENKKVVDCISFNTSDFNGLTYSCLDSIQSEATLVNGTPTPLHFGSGSAVAAHENFLSGHPPRVGVVAGRFRTVAPTGGSHIFN
jgi:hypothetical protein